MAPEAPSQVGAGIASARDERDEPLEVEKGVVAIECLCKDVQIVNKL
jgi:hypothetical protein